MRDGFHLALLHRRDAQGASDILRDQDTRTRELDEAMVANLDRTKEIGLREPRAARVGRPRSTYAELMHEHWLNKRARSSGCRARRVDELYELARAQRGGRRQAGRRGRWRLPARLHDRAGAHTRAALADADAPEVRFGFDFQGCFGQEYR